MDVYRVTDNVCDLIIAADYYGFSSVLTDCSNFLIKLLTISSCISIWSFSNDFNLSEVEEAAFDYILRHFVKVRDFLRRLYSNNLLLRYTKRCRRSLYFPNRCSTG